MPIAISTQNAVVIIVIALAIFMLIRQVYRLVTGKVTKCSCSSEICPTGDEKGEQGPTDDEATKPSGENDKKPEQEDK